MALASLTLLAIAAVLLAVTGVRMVRASRGSAAGSALRGGGFGVLATAAGVAMMSAAPAPTAPADVLGFAALMFGFGAIWAAARRLRGGTAPRPTAAALGGIGWLVWVLAAEPSPGWRVGASSAILAAYSVLGARDLLRVRAEGRPPQRRGGIALAANGAFHVVRAVLGPSLPPLGAIGLLGLETMPVAVLFGTALLAMGRGRAVPLPSASPPAEATLEDELTGIGNLRALSESGAALVAEAASGGRPLALLVMDLDGFRDVNDRHGAAAGDRLLVAFARLAHDYLPPTSLVCRLGGDAFAALLPGADASRARAVADALRSLFAHLRLPGADGPVAARVSIGIAQLRPGRMDLAELLDCALRCLDAAKRTGRDQVAHEADAPDARFRPAA